MSSVVNVDRDQASNCLNQAYLWIEALKFNDRGLVPTIIQDHSDSTVLRLAWMDRNSIQRVFRSGAVVDTEYVLKVKSIFYDCDRDTLLLKVEQPLS